MHGRRASSPFVSTAQIPGRAAESGVGSSLLSPGCVPPFLLSSESNRGPSVFKAEGDAADSGDPLDHSRSTFSAAKAEPLVNVWMAEESLPEGNSTSFQSFLPPNVVFDEREVVGDLPASAEERTLVVHEAPSITTAISPEDLPPALTSPRAGPPSSPGGGTDQPRPGAMAMESSARWPTAPQEERAVETEASHPERRATEWTMLEGSAVVPSRPSELAFILDALLDEIIGGLQEKPDGCPQALVEPALQSVPPLPPPPLAALAPSELPTCVALQSVSITRAGKGTNLASLPEPRQHRLSAPTRDEVHRASTPTSFRHPVVHYKASSRSGGSTWQHYCSTTVSSVADRSDDGGEEDGDEGDEWGGDCGDDVFPGSTSGLDDMQDGEVELLTVSPTVGYRSYRSHMEIGGST